MNNSSHVNSNDYVPCPYMYAVNAFFTTTLALISLAAFIGNTLVIAAVYKTPILRTSTNYYYINMAVSDFLCCLVTWPLYLTDVLVTSSGSLIQGPLATAGCKVGVFLRTASYSVSNTTLVLIAVDRFIAIVFPLKATMLTRKIRLVLTFATWVISLSCCFPNLFFSKVKSFGHVTSCSFAWDSLTAVIYYTAGLSMAAVAPLVAIVILYFRIMCVLKRNSIHEFNTRSNNFEQKRRTQNQNIMNIFKSIVVAYFVCWFMLCICIILQITSPEIFFEDSCGWILGFSYYVFPSLSTVINPVILFSFSSNFRHTFRTLCPLSVSECSSCFNVRIISPDQGNECLPELVAHRMNERKREHDIEKST